MTRDRALTWRAYILRPHWTLRTSAARRTCAALLRSPPLAPRRRGLRCILIHHSQERPSARTGRLGLSAKINRRRAASAGFGEPAGPGGGRIRRNPGYI